jgi:uncharacterized SAM-binding protein YcdF (DUF218 family)
VGTWQRVIRGLGIFVLVIFLATSLTPISNVAGDRLSVPGTPEPADVIVVLGAGLMRDDVLVEESLRRTIRGVELFKEGLAPLIVLLGPGFRGSKRTEAAVREQFVRTMGIPAAAILRVETAATTREEAAQTARVLHARGLSKILLVTESLHMRRAALVFKHSGLNVVPAASNHYPTALHDPEGRLWLGMRIVQEAAALLYYRIAGYI